METVDYVEGGCGFLGLGDVVGGKYRVLGLLGEGGVACVYEAEHIYTGRRVALKVLKPLVAAAHPRLRERFLEEPRKTPDDPGVVEVLDAGVDEATGMPYLVMELYPKSLRKLMEEGVPCDRLLAILLEVAETVARLHEKGLVHLDIKPENILIGRDGRPRLGDFGFARLKAETFGRTTVWGTPVYTAPEVWAGTYSDKSDVYSLGVISQKY